MNNKEYTKNTKRTSPPSEIDEFLTSFEFSDILNKIEAKYNLLEKQDDGRKVEDSNKRKLVKIVSKTLEGEMILGHFNKSLKEELGLSNERTEVISKEINQRIFLRFQTALEKLYGGEVKKRENSEASLILETSGKGPQTRKKDDVYREPLE
jgi:hypothetical protein